VHGEFKITRSLERGTCPALFVILDVASIGVTDHIVTAFDDVAPLIVEAAFCEKLTQQNPCR
jgi:hypothetical protein